MRREASSLVLICTMVFSATMASAAAPKACDHRANLIDCREFARSGDAAAIALRFPAFDRNHVFRACEEAAKAQHAAWALECLRNSQGSLTPEQQNELTVAQLIGWKVELPQAKKDLEAIAGTAKTSACRAAIYNNLGTIAYYSKAYDEAIEDYEKALSAVGQEAEGSYHTTAPARAPIVDSLLSCYSEAVSADDIRINVAHAYLSKGDFAKTTALVAGLRPSQKRLDLQFRIAVNATSNSNYDVAQSSIDDLLAKSKISDSQKRTLTKLRGIIAFQQKKYTDALSYFQAAASLKVPADPRETFEIHRGLAAAYYEMNDYDNAVAEYGRIRKSARDDQERRYVDAGLGAALIERGAARSSETDIENGMAMLQTAKPWPPEVANNLSRYEPFALLHLAVLKPEGKAQYIRQVVFRERAGDRPNCPTEKESGEAVHLLDRVIVDGDTSPDNIALRKFRGAYRYCLEDYGPAAADYDAVADATKDNNSRYLAAFAYSKAHDHEKAVKAISTALNGTFDSHEEQRYVLALAVEIFGDKDPAGRNAHCTYISLEPGADSNAAMGDCQLGYRDIDAAAKAYESVADPARRENRLAAVRVQSGRGCVADYEHAAAAFEEMGLPFNAANARYIAALDQWVRQRLLNPAADPSVLEQQHKVMLNMASTAKLDDGQRDLAWKYVGDTSYMMGRWSDAIDAYARSRNAMAKEWLQLAHASQDQKLTAKDIDFSTYELHPKCTATTADMK